MRVDLVEGGEQALAALLVEAGDRGAQFLDRFGEVVALGHHLVALRLDLGEFVLGAQIDGAEPFAIGASDSSSRRSMSAIAGRSSSGFDAGELRRAPAASISRSMRDGALDVGDALARGLQLRLAARLLLARGAHRLERRAGGAVGFGETRLGGGARVGRVAARGLGLFDAAFISARRWPMKVSGASAMRCCSSARVAEPLFQFGDAVLRAIAALRP